MRGLSMQVAAFVAAFALGCAVGPAAPPDRFYRLAPDVSAAPLAAPALDGLVSVERLRADGLVRERSIVWSEGSGDLELRQHAYDRWVDSPVDMLQEKLVAYLRARGAARGVVTPELRLRPDYVISGRLLRFERVLDGSGASALVEMRLALSDARDGRLVFQETYREEEAAPSEDVAASVAAFDTAALRAFARFVDDAARGGPSS